MQSVLVDTDVAIDFLRGSEYAKKLIIPLWKENAAFLSILSAYELYAGMRESESATTNDFINAFNIEPVTLEIARRGGELFRLHRGKGAALTAMDCLIAATASVNGRRIATRNVKHYPDGNLLLRPKDG